VKSELEELRRLSASIGASPELTQAAGGNTSIKLGDTMWIKASGTWLAHALDRDIFIPIVLSRLSEGMDRNDPACETCIDYIDRELNLSNLMPSVETTVHAAMPERVVVHVHCVETIAWAVRADAEQVLAPILRDYSWKFVPYARPGIPLAQAMKRRLQPGNDVAVLGNHGLVVAAATVAAAQLLLVQVTCALRRRVRLAPTPDLARLREMAEGSAYRLPDDITIHAVATDPLSLAHASKGSLYPDHVVFLGPGVFALQRGESLDGAMERARGVGLGEPRILLVPGAGVLVHRASLPAVQPMARCLADVTSRIAQDEPVSALSDADVDALINWDAEKYRQSLARAG
jgi:rhamnose utilization protein RhaD (predicted bifunctional aldolase and dehydrogenase)